MTMAPHSASQRQPSQRQLEAAHAAVCRMCRQTAAAGCTAELCSVVLTCLHQLRKAVSGGPAAQQPVVTALLSASAMVLARAVSQSGAAAAVELVARHAGSVAAMLVAAARAAYDPETSSLAAALETLQDTVRSTRWGFDVSCCFTVSCGEPSPQLSTQHSEPSDDDAPEQGYGEQQQAIS